MARLPRPRSRRGLADFVGEISQRLFGTATVSQITDIQRAVDENRGTLNNVVHTQRALISVVNDTFISTRKNAEVITQIVNVTQRLQVWVGQMTQVAHGLRDLRTYNHMAEAIDLIHEQVTLLHQWRRETQERQDQLAEGRLSSLLLNPKVLKEIAELNHVEGVSLVWPHQWYYEPGNVRILPLWDHKETAFAVILPLVGPKPIPGYQIRSYPVPIPNSTEYSARLLVTPLIASDVMRNRAVTMEHCVGNGPYVCNPGAVTKSTGQKCAHAVVTERGVKEHCALEVSRHPWLTLGPTPNHVIISTHEETVVERCPNGATTPMTLKEGVFSVTWKGECVLDSGDFRIQGVELRSISWTLKSRKWEVANISFDIATEAQQMAPVWYTKVNLPHLESGIRIPLKMALPSQLPEIDWENENGSSSIVTMFWPLLCTVVIIILVIICYISFKCYKLTESSVKVAEKVPEVTQASAPIAKKDATLAPLLSSNDGPVVTDPVETTHASLPVRNNATFPFINAAVLCSGDSAKIL